MKAMRGWRPRRGLLAGILGLALPALVAALQAQRTPASALDSSKAAFQDAKVGLFIHWGIYSLLADGEWVMNNRSIRTSEYEHLAPRFNPARFDARGWVALAKRAGIRYITMTTKHHDGFAMYDTKLSDWDIIDRTPFRRDIIAELAAAFREAGMPLVLYYSQLDWHHPDYFPRGGTGQQSGRPESGEFGRYLAYMDGQLEELLTRYGKVAGIWFDGMWDNGQVDWQLSRTYAMIKRHQPWALIGSNHNNLPHQGEDFIPFEGYVRPANVPAGAGFPLEVAEKINDTWGYRAHDRSYKTATELIRNLVKAAGAGANYLINVGPMADGTLQPEFVERLGAIGDWLARYGESIYGTRAGPIAARPWGVSTARGDTVFVHVLDWKDRLLPLSGLGRTVVRARYVGRPGAPTVTLVPGGVALGIDPPGKDEVDVVIALELKGPR